MNSLARALALTAFLAGIFAAHLSCAGADRDTDALQRLDAIVRQDGYSLLKLTYVNTGRLAAYVRKDGWLVVRVDDQAASESGVKQAMFSITSKDGTNAIREGTAVQRLRREEVRSVPGGGTASFIVNLGDAYAVDAQEGEELVIAYDSSEANETRRVLGPVRATVHWHVFSKS